MYFDHHITTTIEKREPKLEPFILESSKNSYLYAKNVLKKPWKRAESIILEDCEYAYLYAKNVLKKRWKKAEDHLLKFTSEKHFVTRKAYESREFLALYAKHVIKGRWKEAETVIANTKMIGVYMSILESKDLKSFSNLLMAESIADSPIAKKFFAWKPTHVIKMKGSKAFEVMLDEKKDRFGVAFDHIAKATKGIKIVRAYRLHEWLDDSNPTDIECDIEKDLWYWKRPPYSANQSFFLKGTVTPLS